MRFRYLPRFSLSTLMLLVTISAVSVNLVITYRKLSLTTVELDKYRKEIGYLDIGDKNKIHARAVRTVGSLRWAWRIHIPENKKYVLHELTGNIPTHSGSITYIDNVAQPISRDDFPDTINLLVLPAGEYVLYANVERSGDDQWVLTTRYNDITNKTPIIHSSDTTWLGGKGGGWASTSSYVSQDITFITEPGRPMQLLRFCITKMVNGGMSSNHLPPISPDGLLIWIEEATPDKNLD
jgi:hypothetical protein